MSKKVCWLLLFPYLLGACAFSQPNDARRPQSEWVNHTIDTLTAEQKISQLIWLLCHPNDQQDIEYLVQKYQPGGIIFRDFSYEQLAEVVPELRRVSTVPLLLAVENSPSFTGRQTEVNLPAAATLRAVNNDERLYQAGRITAQHYRSIGIHLLLSATTVADDDLSRQENATAQKKVRAYAQGMADHGLIPGLWWSAAHGAASSADQPKSGLASYQEHQTLVVPTVAGMLQPAVPTAAPADPQLANVSSPPFGATDGLTFSTVSDQPAEAMAALKSGHHVLVSSQTIAAMHPVVTRPLRNRRLKDVVRRGVAQQLRLKYQAGLDLAEKEVPAPTDTEQTKLLKQQLYEEAITVVHNQKELLPIRSLEDRTFAALSLIDHPQQALSFRESLDHYAPFAHYAVPRRSERFDYEQIYDRLRRYDHVVVGIHGAHRRVGLHKKTMAFLKFLDEETNVTVVLFDEPKQLRHFTDFSTLVCGYENDSLAQWVVPQVLFGARPARGTLPVRVNDDLPVGAGMATEATGRLAYTLPGAVGLSADTLRLIDSLAHWAIRQQATPGCQVLVARRGAVVYQKSYGYQTYDSLSPINNQTIYDIASVTKVAATTQAMMFLQERGAIRLDDKVATYLPELRSTDKRNITIRELLLHRAGLRSYMPFWQMTRNKYGLNTALYRFSLETDFSAPVASGLYATPSLRDSLWQWTVRSKVIKQRGRRVAGKPRYDYRYSDLGFYMLHRLIEEVTQQSLSDFMQQNFYTPLGLSTLAYRPLCHFSQDRIAPTEEDKLFRNTLVRGTVHDEGAALCGGVAAHAGLFSTAHDLAVLMQMNLQNGYYGGTRYFQPGTVARFSTRQFNDSRRALGWDKPEHQRNGGPTAPEASYDSYGHLGFTGTSAWVDPKYDLVYIFLSNRVHPDARNTKLLTEGIRTKIQSVVYRAMEDYEGK